MVCYKVIDVYRNRVCKFNGKHPFVVLALRVEIWPFPTSATLAKIQTSQNILQSHVSDFCLLFLNEAKATTCFENPCYQNIQITISDRNFPDMPINTFDQQFVQLQLSASNLDLLFQATDEFEDTLTTLRNTASRILNPLTDLKNFLTILQCEKNSNRALTFDEQYTQNQNT
ncbi:MAG: hypothetical protein EZS28_000371 [Streblomastix strix]|uniref:Uncharacterized protein n=1 Tax=Streblomastix strix TaxID=222440 RepID=A0A5J4XAB5_9EUKA|nr:MAG: hypothetical protein EZS28_000371 [Streblomastix strix]